MVPDFWLLGGAKKLAKLGRIAGRSCDFFACRFFGFQLRPAWVPVALPLGTPWGGSALRGYAVLFSLPAALFGVWAVFAAVLPTAFFGVVC